MTVHGVDNRRVIKPNEPNFTSFPLPAVTAIDSTINADSNAPFGYGTGVVISPHYVLTAAHNLYDSFYGEQDKIRISTSGNQINLGSRKIDDPDPNYSNDPGANVNVSTGLFFPTDYKNKTTAKNDIAFVRVDDNALISPAPSVGLIAFMNPKTARGSKETPTKIQTAGYPVDNVNIPNNTGKPIRDLVLAPGIFGQFGTIHTTIGREMLYSYDIDTEGGQSGSPVWHIVEGDTTPRVLGVHSRGNIPRNSGTLIDKDIYDQIIDQIEGDGNANDLPENAIIGSDPSIIPINTPFTSSGNDEIFGTYRKERIIGNGGNDKLFGGGADDRLEGGDGVDQALFSDVFTNYKWEITDTANPAFEFIHSKGSKIDATDTTKDIEFGVFEFTDADGDNKDDDDSLFFVPLQVDPNDVYPDGKAKLKDGPLIYPKEDVLDEEGESIATMTVESPAWMFDGDVKYNLTIGLETTELYNLAFIIDRSGSMSGSPIAQTKNAFKQLIDSFVESGLDSQTKYSIISFSGNATRVDTEDSSIAKNVIDGLSAFGPTVYSGALSSATAFFAANNPFNSTDIAYFLSDGQPSADPYQLPALALKTAADKVHAFGVGDAHLSTLNIIDSEGQAVLLSSAGDLFDEFDTSIDKDTIEHINVRITNPTQNKNNKIIETITPDQLIKNGFNLTYEGSIGDLEVSQEAENEITFELVFKEDTGIPTQLLDYKITTGQEEIKQQTNNGTTEIITFSVNQSDFTDTNANTSTNQFSITNNSNSLPPLDADNNVIEERDIIGNELDNIIEIQDQNNIVWGNGGNDRFILLGGNSFIYGGEGIDTVEINQTQAEVGEISKDGSIIFIGPNHTAQDIEFIELSDVRLAADTLEIIPIVSFPNKVISVAEGDTGSTFAIFKIELSSIATEDVVIDISSRSDFADLGIDFVEPIEQLTIPAGKSSRNLVIRILGDTEIEEDEEIYLDLTIASGSATFSNGILSETIGVNIVDNETNFITDEDRSIAISGAGLISDYAGRLYGDDIEDNFSLISVDRAINGTAILNEDGNIEFIPTANFNGTASFEYTITDGTNNRVELVEIIVNTVNDNFTLINDTITIDEDIPITIFPTELLSNDTGDNLSILTLSNTANGTAVLNQNGDIEFTPDANFNGIASFDYIVTNGTITTTNAKASVEVVVNPINDIPIANKDIIRTYKYTFLTILATELISNDIDVDPEDSLSLIEIDNFVNGTAILNNDGNIEFTPDANFNGIASFDYTITDGIDNATGSVVIVPLNQQGNDTLSGGNHW
ncbi:MAG: cadherin-like domain-containing protein [Cyanobacteria bacterium P01_F01_bin.143]